MPRNAPRKPPRKVSPAYLERAALAYLERFAASAESLRRVLLRKVERSARAHDTDRDFYLTATEAIAYGLADKIVDKA